jgi:DUF1365 family protein
MSPVEASVPPRLFVGFTHHIRRTPKHRFRYPIFQWLIDIDGIKSGLESSRIARFGRYGIFSYWPKDHGSRSSLDLRPWVKSVLEAAAIDMPAGRIELLAFPRILGFVFNPLSVFLIHDPSGNLKALIYEVNNTFGERHAYAAEITGPSDLDHGAAKRFFVSPFYAVSGEYRFRIQQCPDTFSLTVRKLESGSVDFVALLSLQEKAMTDHNLIDLFWRMPLMSLGVVFAIHWEAIRIAIKGVGLRPRTPFNKGVTRAHPVSQNERS